MIHIRGSDIVRGLSKEACIGGLSVEYLSCYSCIYISPKWRHQTAIIAERESIRRELRNLDQKRNNAIGVDLN